MQAAFHTPEGRGVSTGVEAAFLTPEGHGVQAGVELVVEAEERHREAGHLEARDIRADEAPGDRDALTAEDPGNAVEGRVDVEAMAEAGNLLTNYTQLFEEKVDLSFEDDNTARKIGNTRDVLKREAMTRVMRDLARTAIDGVAVAPTRTTPSLTRGLDRWLNLAGGLVTNVGGAFTEGTLQTALATLRLSGGMPNAIVMSVGKKATFNGFTGAGVTQVAMDAGNTTVGRITNAYLADGFGEIPIIVDLDMPDDKVYIVNSNKMFKGWKKNDELRFVAETNTNSREKAETLQGRMGLAVEGVGTDHMVLAGLS